MNMMTLSQGQQPHPCRDGGSDQEFGPALELPLGLSGIGQDEAAKCSGRSAWGVYNISNAAGRVLTQIDFVAPPGPGNHDRLVRGCGARPANRL
jgi:hypothetical protein